MKGLVSSLKPRIHDGLARYFMFWASFSLKRWQPRVIVITGSVGKTGLLHILAQQFGEKAHYSFGANTEIGIAMDILGEQGVSDSRWHWLRLLLVAPIKAAYFKRQPSYYLVEFDLAKPNRAARLASWLKPERTIWISKSRAHADNFENISARSGKSVEQLIADEMLALAQKTSSAIYIDASQTDMASALKPVANKLVAVTNDLLDYQLQADSCSFIFKTASFRFSSPQPKPVSLQLAYCLKLCQDLGIKLQTDLRKMELPPGRSSYFVGKGGYGMIDSSYNAQIESMLALLTMFDSIKTKHKWAVIGDMIEQANYSQIEHQRLAKALLKLDLDRLVLVGKRTKQYVYPDLKAKNPQKVVSFIQPKQALEYLLAELKGKELILFKGSLFLEGIIEALLKDPTQAANLCRRNRLARNWRNRWGLP